MISRLDIILSTFFSKIALVTEKLQRQESDRPTFLSHSVAACIQLVGPTSKSTSSSNHINNAMGIGGQREGAKASVEKQYAHTNVIDTLEVTCTTGVRTRVTIFVDTVTLCAGACSLPSKPSQLCCSLA